MAGCAAACAPAIATVAGDEATGAVTEVGSVTRRQLLKRTVAVGAAAGLGLPAIVRAAAGPIGIGCLLPLSGDASAYARQMRFGIEAAIAEVNGQGGVLGRPLAVECADSETSPRILASLCDRLIARGALAVVGPWVAAGRRYAASHLASRGVPLVYGSNHEGTFCHGQLFGLGPTPNHDAHPLVRYLDATGAGKSYALLGSSTSWPRALFRQVGATIEALGGTIVGQATTPVGEHDFRPMVAWLEGTGAEIVLFCVMRPNSHKFIHQAGAAGLLDRITVGWIGCNEALIDGLDLGPQVRIVTATTFAGNDPAPAARDFVARVRRQQGDGVSVSYLAMTHYNAIKALAAAWARAGEPTAAAARAGLAGLTLVGPSGPITIEAASQHTAMNVVIARPGAGGLDVIERLGQVEPAVGCSVARSAPTLPRAGSPD